MLLNGGKRGSSWVVSDPSNSLRAEEVQNQVLSLRPPSLRFPLWKISRSTYETRITMEMPCFSNPCRIVYPSLNLGLIFHSSPSPSLPPVTLWPQRRPGHHAPMDFWSIVFYGYCVHNGSSVQVLARLRSLLLVSCELGLIETTGPTGGTQHREYWGGPTNGQAAACRRRLAAKAKPRPRGGLDASFVSPTATSFSSGASSSPPSGRAGSRPSISVTKIVAGAFLQAAR